MVFGNQLDTKYVRKKYEYNERSVEVTIGEIDWYSICIYLRHKSKNKNWLKKIFILIN